MGFSVTQLRIGILLLNLLLTLAVGAQAYYGIFHPLEVTPALKDSPNPNDLKYIEGSGIASGPGQTSQVVEIVRRLRTEVPPPLPPSDEEKKEDEPPPVMDEDGLTPGPLDEKWEYVHCIIYRENPERNRATLQKKSAAGTKTPVRIRPTTRTIRSSSIRSRTSAIRRTIPGVASNLKTLKAGKPWIDQEEDINVWVHEITPLKFIYEDKTTKRRHALVREQESIYEEEAGEIRKLKNKEEESDPKDQVAKDGKTDEKHFHPDRPSFDYEAWKSGQTGGTGDASLTPNASHGAQQGNRPLSKAEELQNLGETLEAIKKSKKYQNVSKKQREQLDALLKNRPGNRAR